MPRLGLRVKHGRHACAATSRRRTLRSLIADELLIERLWIDSARACVGRRGSAMAHYRHDLQTRGSNPARRGSETTSTHSRTECKQYTQCAETTYPTAPHGLAGFQRHTHLYARKPDRLPVLRLRARRDCRARVMQVAAYAFSAPPPITSPTPAAPTPPTVMRASVIRPRSRRLHAPRQCGA